MTVVLVCGSRDWTDWEAIGVELDRKEWWENPPTILHGDAAGADTMAAIHAEAYGYEVKAFPADWSRGKRAGPERNRRMLDQKPDLVIAFQRNGSRGTQHTIDEARRRGIPVEVHT